MADAIHEDGREIWNVATPPGGWGQPWLQCIELARKTSSPALDIVLHLETPATTVPQVTGILQSMGYTLQTSIDFSAPAHRFVRGEEQVEVMVADQIAPRVPQRLADTTCSPCRRAPRR